METIASIHSFKLTEEQKQQVKNFLLDKRGIKQEWIAKQFGVAQCTISYYNRKLKSTGQKSGR